MENHKNNFHTRSKNADCNQGKTVIGRRPQFMYVKTIISPEHLLAQEIKYTHLYIITESSKFE